MSAGSSTGLLDLPPEILEEIAFRTDDQSVVKFCQIHSETAKICRDRTFWIRKVHQEFPDLKDTRIDWWFTDPETSDPYPFKNYVRLVTGQGFKWEGSVTYGSENYLGMHYVIERAGVSGDLELVKWLIDIKGIDPNIILYSAGTSGNLELIKWLFDKGIDPNFQDHALLEGVIASGNLDSIKWLADVKGMDINKESLYSKGIIHNLELAKWLIDVKRIDVDFITGSTGLSISLELAKWLVDERGGNPNNILYNYVIVKSINADLVKWLVEVKGLTSYSLVNSVIKFGSLELVKWLIDNKGIRIPRILKLRENVNLDLVKWLIDDKGVEASNISDIGNFKHIEIIDFLISKGIDPNQLIQDASYSNNIEVVKWLVEVKGADPKRGISGAGHSDNLEMVQWLVKMGADPDQAFIRDGGNIELQKWIFNNGTLNLWDVTANADIYHDFEFLKWLIQVKGANPDWKVSSAGYSENYKLIKWLIGHGGDPRLAIDGATINEDKELLEWLKNKITERGLE